MTSGPEPVGTLDVALAHAEQLLASAPRLAAEQAREILGAVPNHPAATLLLAMACRRTNDIAEAVRIIEPLAASQPRWAAAQRELGLALGDAGRGDEAVVALRHAVRLQPTMADAWRALGDHLFAMGDTRRCRPGLRQPRPQLDARPATDGAGARAGRRPHRRRRAAAAQSPEAVSDRRRRHPHAGGNRFAHRALRRRRKPAHALPRTGARLQGRSSQLRRGAAPEQQAGRSARPDRRAAGGRAAQPELPQPEGRGAGARRRVRRSHPPLRATARRVPAAREGVDEPRPCAQDRRPTGRCDRRLPQVDRAGTGPRRGLLEPGQPEDVPLLRRGRRGDARAARTRATSRRKIASTSTSRSARRGGRERLRRIVPPLRGRQPSAQGSACPTTATRRRERAPLTRVVHAGILCGTPQCRVHGARPDLHRRPAALGLDPGRTDPVEPFRDRRHDGAAGRDRHRQGPARPQPALGSLEVPRRARDTGPGRTARARRALPASRPASSARRTRPSSSTRCRTTSRTSA